MSNIYKFFKSCSIFSNLSFNSFCSLIRDFFFSARSLFKGELKYFGKKQKKLTLQQQCQEHQLLKLETKENRKMELTIYFINYKL